MCIREDDADMLIVQRVLQFAIEGSEVGVVADDNNALVLQVHHRNRTWQVCTSRS